MISEIVAYGVKPSNADSWPVQWAQSEQEALNAAQGLIVTVRELSYYQQGVKLFSSITCYESLQRGQHRFLEAVLKRQGRYPETLLDPTAGWGRDAMAAALIGVKVTAIEKQPLPLCFLLYAQHFLYPKLQERLTVIPGCFSQQTFLPEQFECVYLDPLFFDHKKTTSKKAMTLLYQSGLSENAENDLLIEGLQRLQPHTLIVKQPLKAPLPTLPQILSHSRSSRSCRYDIFYINHKKINYAALFS